MATIVFMGEDAFSNIVLSSLLKAGHKVPLIVSPLYDNNTHKRLENTAVSNGCEYIREKNINSQHIVEKLKNIQPDLLITAHFEKLIHKEIIDIPKLGCLNLHPSLLPYYRGMAPQHWPIINGEKETGITVHFIDETADTGNIVLQKKIALNDKMYVSDLQLIWSKMYQTIMCEAIEKVLNGYRGEPQNKLDGSYYGKLKSSQCKIDMTGSVKNAYNLIRGVSMPYHGAFVETNDGTYTIWRAEIVSRASLAKTGQTEMFVGILPPPNIHKNNELQIYFNDGVLLVKNMNLTPQKKVITSHAEITRAMTIIKSCHEGFMTNFFFGEKRCELLIKKQVLFIITCNKCAFILHKDFDFYHLYYITTNNDMLTKSLEILTEKFPNERFVSDIVGMKTAVSNIVPVFECFGFKKYSQLYRMSRVKNLDEPQHLDERVKYAKLEHAEQIKTLLEQYFDPYSEQIPMIDEIRKQIETQSILIVAEKENIIGFVIFEINGVTSYLRYWFTHPDHRDKKVGSALLRRFFHECRATKRQLFWVIENNENAIVRYKHYGFEQEQLFDQIMIRK